MYPVDPVPARSLSVGMACSTSSSLCTSQRSDLVLDCTGSQRPQTSRLRARKRPGAPAARQGTTRLQDLPSHSLSAPKHPRALSLIVHGLTSVRDCLRHSVGLPLNASDLRTHAIPVGRITPKCAAMCHYWEGLERYTLDWESLLNDQSSRVLLPE